MTRNLNGPGHNGLADFGHYYYYCYYFHHRHYHHHYYHHRYYHYRYYHHHRRNFVSSNMPLFSHSDARVICPRCGLYCYKLHLYVDVERDIFS